MKQQTSEQLLQQIHEYIGKPFLYAGADGTL